MATKTLVFAVLSAVLLVTVASAKKCSGPFCLNDDDCKLGQVTCKDCHSRLFCTPLGAISHPCWIPGLQYCSEGHCVRQPSTQCQPPPLPTTEGPTTTKESTSTSVRGY
ncbi:uncharacterized protein [Choristoneura fumiferana]|uniref:uncharacterized protein n=1 Tax=Choristoneura fumiferana TaxID=7141 RepID=UPI003D15A2AE